MAGEAWIQFATGNKAEAISLIQLAANMEDSIEKHPVTPGEVLPARELMADMYLGMHQNQNALQASEAVLKKSPNRFNSLYGAGKSGDEKKTLQYYRQILAITDSASDRKELVEVRKFLSAH